MIFETGLLADGLGDRYRLLEQLGQGAYGTVFKAIQTSTGQPVAIKVQRLVAEQTDEQRAGRVARFERETMLCATLNHPNIVRIIDQGRSGDLLLMVFEFVPGETLTQVLARRRVLPLTEAAALMAQVLEALATAHAQGIIHRDLKPDNMMVVSAGNKPYLKVLDFGIGAYFTDVAGQLPALTRSQEIVGTPSYSAPEQLRGEPATPRSDIYSWGLVFLECLTGRRTIDGATVAQAFYQQLSSAEIQLPASIAMHPLGDLLRRALAKSSRERTSDAGRLGKDLVELRLSDLVGSFEGPGGALPATTQVLEAVRSPGELRQATVLSCALSVVSACPVPPDLETFDAIQRDQLNACVDVTTRFGGHVVGRLGGRVMVVFGFPQASDSDARRACRAALEVFARIESRRALLTSQRGLDLEVRIGIHTGGVLVDGDGVPGGPAFNVAGRLESIAAVGTTLVSETTRNLLCRKLHFQPTEHPGINGAAAPLKPFVLLSEGASDTDPLLASGIRSALVGREKEMATLGQLWDAARQGRGGVVLLTGDPGVGKSRLVQEIRRRAVEADAPCYECQCFPEEVNSALYPVLTFLREHLRSTGDQPEARLAYLEWALRACGLDPAESMPVLASWLALPASERYPRPKASGDRQREVLLEALARLFVTTPSGEPRLIVIEDLHWSDHTTRQWVTRVAELAPQFGILVLLTARAEFGQPPAQAQLLEVQGLDQAAVERLVAANVGELGLEPEVLASIVARADGIPLFVEELSRSMLASRTQGHPAGRPGGEIPGTLHDLLYSRLDRLGPAKETAQFAAAIGRDFDLDLLDAISTRGREALQAHMDALVEANMLRRRLEATGTRYEFRHALIQEAAHDSVLSAGRRSMHGRIAAALEQRATVGGTLPVARLARHHELAGGAEKAIHYRLLASQGAAQASAHQEAHEHLRVALGLLAGVDDLDRRASLEIDLHHALGGVLIAMQGLAGPDVVAAYTRSWDLVRDGSPSPVQSFRTLRGLWTFHNARAEYPRADDIVTRMLELAGQHEGAEVHLAAHECAAQTALLVGKFQSTVHHSRASARWFDPALQREHIARYATDPWLTAQSFACIALTVLGFIEKAQSDLETVLAGAETLGIPTLQAMMLGQAGWIDLLCSGCTPGPNALRARAGARGQEAFRLSSEVGFHFGQAYGGLLMGAAAALAGQGVAGLEQTIHFWRLSGSQALLSWLLAFLAQGQLAMGDPTGAVASAEAALEHCQRTGEAYGASEAQRALGLALRARNQAGDRERASAAFGQAVEIATQQEARWLALRAAYSAAHGSPSVDSQAHAGLLREVRWFQEQGTGLTTPLLVDSLALLAS